MELDFKVLIVDDSSLNRAILSDILSDEYQILEATNGLEALEIIKKDQTISMILLDLVMPKMDGFTFLEEFKKLGLLESIPVIMISSELEGLKMEKAYDLGVQDYISRPFDAKVVKKRVSNLILLFAKQKKLMALVSKHIDEKMKNNNVMISILSQIVEYRNGESGLHVKHINLIVDIILRKLLTKTNKYPLTEEDIDIIRLGSSLHDIGKIGINENILNKPGKLTFEEFEIMKTHSKIGADILKSLNSYQDEKIIKVAYDICLHHHEKWDGRGYPDGLKGDEIPISAQVVSIADCYDALTSERCYKPAYSSKKAIDMITNGECGQFNPLIMECLLECKDEIKKEMDKCEFDDPMSNYNIQEKIKNELGE